MTKPPFHGRDHRPAKYGGTAATTGGGADQITGMLYLPSATETDGQVLSRDSTAAHGLAWADATAGGAGTYQNPDTKYELSGTDWWLFYDDALNSGFAPVRINTSPSGHYFECTSQNSYFIMGCPLGPAGSRWRVDMWWSRGSDYGIANLEWQTTAAAVGGESSQSVDVPSTGGTWYHVAAPGVYQVDAYSAGSADTPYDTQLSLMTPTGADGAMLSSNGSASAVFTNTSDMNGGGDGSVWWWLRLKVATKNASSSGYRFRVHTIRITRLISTGWTPI